MDVVDQKVWERRLRYIGHVCRVHPRRLPYICFRGRVEGKRSRGRPRKWLIDVIKDYSLSNLDLVEAVRSTADQEKWRTLLGLSQRRWPSF